VQVNDSPVSRLPESKATGSSCDRMR
jgi:hypothetical protein